MTDQRSIDAVKDAIAYGKGEISESQLRTAYNDAYNAAYKAYNADAAYAADAAYKAACANSYADAAAYTAYAAYSATAYNADAARKEILLKCADICREVLSEEILTKSR